MYGKLGTTNVYKHKLGSPQGGGGGNSSFKAPQKAHIVSGKVAAADSAALDYSCSTLNCTGTSVHEAEAGVHLSETSASADRVAAADYSTLKTSASADRVAAADFSALKIVRVLSSSDASCSVAVEAKHNTEEGRVLVQLQKTPFDLDKLEEIMSSRTSLLQLFNNDVYSKHTALLPPELNIPCRISSRVNHVGSGIRTRVFPLASGFAHQSTKLVIVDQAGESVVVCILMGLHFTGMCDAV
ncbi:Scavenger mRNA decapping enzyme N-terminal [Trinorchestia longiramus]|nr:Scavenger mRNA decapping enzyme N-terminal [Trinorchestia longiramus]